MGVRRHPKRDKHIARVADILKKEKRPAIDPDILFGRVSADDVVTFRPDALASAAADAHRQLMGWDGKGALVNVETVEGIDVAGRPVTLVSIIDRNMPFLFDSVMAEISTSHRDTFLAAHPILSVSHGKGGKVEDVVLYVAGESDEDWSKVSLIQVYLPNISAAAMGELKDCLLKVLDQVHRAVVDWRGMLEKLDGVIDELEASSAFHHVAERDEALAFLSWLRDDNFTFLGMREYHYAGTGKEARVERAEDTGLGILSDPNVRVLRRGTDHVTTTPELLAFLQGPRRTHRYEGQCAFARASARLHGLHRRQALRRKRPGHRRTPDRRPVHLDGLYPVGHPHSAAALQGRRGHCQFRLRFGKPLGQGAAERPGKLSARRAVPGRCADARRLLRTDHGAQRPAARSGVAAHRSIRPLRLRDGLRSARPIQFRCPRAHRRLSQGCLRRPALGLLSGLPGRRASRASISCSVVQPARRRV